MWPQSATQARSPRRVEFRLVPVEDYIDMNVFVAIVVEFPLDKYGVEFEGVSKTSDKQFADYIGNSVRGPAEWS